MYLGWMSEMKKPGAKVQRVHNPVWKEFTDSFGRPKLECYEEGKMMGKVIYAPENIGKPWKAFVPGPNVWQEFFFPDEKEAKDFVIDRYSLRSISPHTKQNKLLVRLPIPVGKQYDEEQYDEPEEGEI
jgi:hypothetical protein